MKSVLLFLAAAASLSCGLVAADSNAERFARGLGPLPPRPRRHDAMWKRNGPSAGLPPAPQGTQLPPTDGSTTSGISLTCGSFYLQNKEFGASCLTNDGQSSHLITSKISLNDCLANINGELLPRAWGHALNSCFDCELSNTHLTCTCKDAAGHDVYDVETDLDATIANRNGVLQCYTTVANAMGQPVR